jgi:hypothetical protein
MRPSTSWPPAPTPWTSTATGGSRRWAEEVGVTHIQTMPWILYGLSGDVLEEKCEGLARFGEEVITKLG